MQFITILILFFTTAVQAEEIYTCKYHISGYDFEIQGPIGDQYCAKIQTLYDELDVKMYAEYGWKSEIEKLKGEQKKTDFLFKDCQFVRDEYIKGFFLAIEYLRQNKRTIRGLRRQVLTLRRRYER